MYLQISKKILHLPPNKHFLPKKTQIFEEKKNIVIGNDIEIVNYVCKVMKKRF